LIDDNNSKTIKLYYHAPDYKNAGDYFGKWLLERMGYNVYFSRNPQLIVCGSILGWFKNKKKNNIKVWGAGFHNYGDRTAIKEPNFYAVRGKLTLKKLNLTSNIALGDPGLLLSVFYKPISKKIFDICIISHSIDYKWFMKNYQDKYYIINMGNNNIEEIANKINQCKFIFSSSLHGIIFSHSLGIPAVHLEHLMLRSKKNYKFKDYYSVLNIPYIKEDIKRNKLEHIIKKYKKNRFKYLPSKIIIKQIQHRLLSSFPFRRLK
jgi:exopolysaccharide biosynthesis predicted pyruvyltransferase EpsI